MRPLTGLRESSNPITNWPRYLSFEILTQKMEMFCIFESSLHIPYPLKISSSFEKYCNLKFIRASSSKRVYENSLRYFCEACSGLQVWSSTAANAHVGLEVVRVVLRIFTSLWWRGAVCTHICKRRVEGRGLTISQKNRIQNIWITPSDFLKFFSKILMDLIKWRPRLSYCFLIWWQH